MEINRQLWLQNFRLSATIKSDDLNTHSVMQDLPDSTKTQIEIILLGVLDVVVMELERIKTNGR